MAELLDRDLYRKIKRMDRNALETLIKEFYDMGRESAEEANADIDALRADIGKIKGIGESRLEEIMDVIQMHLTLG